MSIVMFPFTRPGKWIWQHEWLLAGYGCSTKIIEGLLYFWPFSRSPSMKSAGHLLALTDWKLAYLSFQLVCDRRDGRLSSRSLSVEVIIIWHTVFHWWQRRNQPNDAEQTFPVSVLISGMTNYDLTLNWLSLNCPTNLNALWMSCTRLQTFLGDFQSTSWWTTEFYFQVQSRNWLFPPGLDIKDGLDWNHSRRTRFHTFQWSSSWYYTLPLWQWLQSCDSELQLSHW